MLAILVTVGTGCPLGVTVNRTALRVHSRTKTDGSASVLGVVTERSTHRPIRMAVGVLSCECSEREREAATADDGRFSYSELPPGRYELRVLYGPGREYVRRFTLEDGEQLEMRLSIPSWGMPRLGP